jgi:chemotaxis signal transduction protein
MLRRRKELTEVPLTPELLLGVTNLRGEILPIFDLCRLFRLDTRQAEKTPRLIVLGETHPLFGFVADVVEQVTTLEAAALTSRVASFRYRRSRNRARRYRQRTDHSGRTTAARRCAAHD